MLIHVLHRHLRGDKTSVSNLGVALNADPNYFHQIKAELYYGDPRRQLEIKYGDRFSNERMALIWVIVLNQRILSDIGGLDDCGEKENVELASMDLVKLRKWRKELTKAKGELDEPAGERCWQSM